MTVDAEKALTGEAININAFTLIKRVANPANQNLLD
jgi:hypothetical protein